MKEFIDYAFNHRKETLQMILDGKIKSQEELFLRFTTHNPAMITNGIAGLNGSIKGIGFFPKRKFLKEKVEKFKIAIENKKINRIEFLFNEIYNREEEIDFNYLTTIELARNHTYKNLLNGDKKVTLLFFTPPVLSYEVRGKVKIYDKGPEFEFVNLMHDFYHGKSNWERRIVYLIKIEKIYNNSATPEGYGKKIY